MPELPLATGQCTTDLAKAVCAAELAKQYGYELAPARRSFDGIIGMVLFSGMLKFNEREPLQQLWENARKSLLGQPSFGSRFRRINLTKPDSAMHISFLAQVTSNIVNFS
jgi:hypothetical protein